MNQPNSDLKASAPGRGAGADESRTSTPEYTAKQQESQAPIYRKGEPKAVPWIPTLMECQASNKALALTLAIMGWKVFPCLSNKKPAIKSTHPSDDPLHGKCHGECGKDGHGFYDATSDVEKIKGWNNWELVGIACKMSDFFAVDIDEKDDKHGEASWKALVTNAIGRPSQGWGEVWETGPQQKTPTWGRHIIFKDTDEIKIPNDTDALAKGLDLRSNGYICTGMTPVGAYEWLEGHDYTQPIPDAPDWLLDAIRALGKGEASVITTPVTVGAGEPNSVSIPSISANSEFAGEVDASEYFLNEALLEARVGNRNDTGFILACQLRDSEVGRLEAGEIMRLYAGSVPQGIDDPYTLDNALASLDSAYSTSPRARPHLPRSNINIPLIPCDTPSGIPQGYKETEPAVPTIVTQVYSTWGDMNKVLGPIIWDWQDWLARGFLNILASMSGEGKSALALRICGCYLLGWDWPDGTPFTGATGNVAWCEAEAAQAMNLDRAKKIGLPIDRIFSPLHDPLGDFRLTNPDHLGSLATLAMRPDISFIVIDSLSGADPTAEKSTEDSKNVNWLASLARDTQKVVQLTHHLRKRGMWDLGEDGISLDRLRGISTIIQYSRLIWGIDTPDLGNKENKRLSVIKSNLGKKPKPIGMTINDKGVTFGDAPEVPKTENVIDRAVNLLESLLAKEPIEVTTLQKEFEGAGISWHTANNAKKKRSIIAIKRGDKWVWSLPPGSYT